MQINHEKSFFFIQNYTENEEIRNTTHQQGRMAQGMLWLAYEEIRNTTGFQFVEDVNALWLADEEKKKKDDK